MPFVSVEAHTQVALVEGNNDTDNGLGIIKDVPV
jgi:hypothetical protein